MMGTRPIYNRMFSKRFMHPIYLIFNDKCEQNITIVLWHSLEILTLIGVRGQIQYLFRLLTNKNIISMFKIVREWLITCVPIQFSFLRFACGAIFNSLLLLITAIFVCKHLKVNV